MSEQDLELIASKQMLSDNFAGKIGGPVLSIRRQLLRRQSLFAGFFDDATRNFRRCISEKFRPLKFERLILQVITLVVLMFLSS